MMAATRTSLSAVELEADAVTLEQAARVLRRRSRRPGSFTLRVLIRVLQRTAAGLRNRAGEP